MDCAAALFSRESVRAGHGRPGIALAEWAAAALGTWALRLWDGPEIFEGALTRETVASHLVGLARENGVHRVIVAMPDRRGTLPVEELLELRLNGVKVEEATSWLEKISGRIEVEQLVRQLDDFRRGLPLQHFLPHRAAGVELLGRSGGTDSLTSVVALHSAGGETGFSGARCCTARSGWRKRNVHFFCYKFRTMRQDAEADTGATWAADDDPRITRVGKFLRVSRLDEIPQLWCVLKGDMHFVGPRPERPEFVEWLSKEIPYYGSAPRGAARNYRLGAGAIQIRQHARRCARKAAV